MSDIDRIATLVTSESTLVLATCSETGIPHAAPLFYIADEDLCLYWLSSPSSRHSQNVEFQPEAGVSVFRSTGEWKEILGVQMRGSVSIAALDTVLPAYRSRFRVGPEFDAVIDRCRLYCFRPSWMRLLDNGRTFGYKFETDWPA